MSRARVNPSPRRSSRGDPRVVVRRFAGPAAHVDVLSGMRVAHLTDLHFGRVTPVEVQREAVRRTNEGEPDLVFLTGDYVGYGSGYLDQLVEVLSELRAPAYAVLGNHDHWSGARSVRSALQRAGVEVLDNAHTIATVRGDRLQIVGLDDAYTGHADRERAVRGLRGDLPSIGLSHIGEEADGLWRHGVPLVLSGHTHAGQITVARLHEVAVGRIAGHKYVHGLYGSRAATAGLGALYVSAGIGSSLMPLRVGDRAQSELALFELGAAPGAFDEHHAEQAALPGRPRKQGRKSLRSRWLGERD